MLLMYGLFDIETLLEAIHASAAVHQLLLAGVEGVALGANFDLQLGLDGAGFERLTAHATDGRLAIFGMDLLFHAFSPLFAYAMSSATKRVCHYSIVRMVLQQPNFFPCEYFSKKVEKRY